MLAHLSDPHLAPLPRPGMRELASKRFIGYVNWRRSRQRIHRRDALDAITHDLRGAQPDHVAVTGDLINIALSAEFVQARRWLEALGRPFDVSVVPGNHDAYVAAADLYRDRHWSPYMTGDDVLSDGFRHDDLVRYAAPSSPAGEGRGRGSEGYGKDVSHPTSPTLDPSPQGGGVNTPFPYLRRRGPVALVGVSTAIATPLFMAYGKLGERQIARMAKMLGDLRAENLFRVVMIHHPPIASAHHKRLIDAAAFRQAIAAVGAELIIHGHDHVHSLAWIAGNGVRVPVVGVPSASACAGAEEHACGYNLYRIEGRPGAWRCEVVSRGWRPQGTIAELDRFVLSG